jgi:serine/threonine-protein kinase SRPK3
MPTVPPAFLPPAGKVASGPGGGPKKPRKRGGKRAKAGGGKAPEHNKHADDHGGHHSDSRSDGEYSSDSGDSDTSEDEGEDGYKKGGYHPVKIGETYKDGRYVVLKKLGWGHFSTCWLCADTAAGKISNSPAHVALKVQKSASHYTEAARDEIDILTKIANVDEIDAGGKPPNHHRAGVGENGARLRPKTEGGDGSGMSSGGKDGERGALTKGGATTTSPPPAPHLGSTRVVKLVDAFDHKGPNGLHACMAFEVLGDNLLALIKRYDYRGVPLKAVKAMCRDVLLGLDYLHSRKLIIHTDLKPENILLTTPLPPREEEEEAAPAATAAPAAAAAAGEVKREEEEEEGVGEAAMAAMDLSPSGRGKEDAPAAAAAAAAEGGADDGSGAALTKNQKKKAKKRAKKAGGGGDATRTKGIAPVDGDGGKKGGASKGAKGGGGGGGGKKSRGPLLSQRDVDVLECRIVDLGNACWTYKQFTQDIQTRQYRSPEVILGSKYSTPADVWSLACIAFELATGDLLFDPRTGKDYDRDEDHLALMMELIGRMPKKIALGGKYSRDYFTRQGDLRHIRNLKFWPLAKVLSEKYQFAADDAEEMSAFLMAMLDFAPEKRATAGELLRHAWLKDVMDGIELPRSEAKGEGGGAAEAGGEDGR